jgi:hypothetical protein
MLSELKQANKIVEKVLQEYPITRGNDKELIIKFLEEQGLFLIEDQQKIFKKCFSVESCRRTRERLQEKGLYLPSQDVRSRRLNADIEMRNAVSSQKAGIGHYCFNAEKEVGEWVETARIDCKKCMNESEEFLNQQRQGAFL